jgi:hypothetical protein
MSTYTAVTVATQFVEANGIRFAYRRWGEQGGLPWPDLSFRSFSSGFAEYIGQHGKTREDIKTWFDALDLDDFVSFGGKA